MKNEYAPGDRVLIHENPHHSAAVDIVGEVVSFAPGAGFMGCDLVRVRYEHLRDGSISVMPFSTEKISRGDRESLLARAARHEEQAAALRRLAGNL